MLIKGLNGASVYRSFIPHVTTNISSSEHNGMPLTQKMMKFPDEIFEKSKHLGQFALGKYKFLPGRTFD